MKAELIHFGLMALVPAALSVAAPAAGASILVPVCTGDGQVHMMTVPVGGEQAPGQGSGACCAKGCHSGSSRKRNGDNLRDSNELP